MGGSIGLLCVWFSNGVWHGAAWSYVFFGMYHFVLILGGNMITPLANRFFAKVHLESNSFPYRLFQMVRTTLIFSVGRLITVPDDFSISLPLFQGLFPHFNPWIFWDGTLFTAGLDGANFLLSLLLIAFLLVVEHSQVTHGSIRDRVVTLKLPVRWAVWYGLLAGILILGIYGPGYSASSFAYMNF